VSASVSALRPAGPASLGSLVRRAATASVWYIISIGSVVVLWEVLAALQLINTVLLPPPHETLWEITNQAQFVSPAVSSADKDTASLPALQAVLATMQRVFIGLVLAFTASFLVGGLAFYVSAFGKLTLPTITLLSPIAPIAWLPLAIVLFGVGNNAAIFVVFIGLFFVLSLAVVNTMTNVDQTFINTARVLGASRAQVIRHVILPAALPALFVIMRINFFAAWMAVLIAEAIGVSSGMGMIIWMGRQTMNMKLTFLGMIMIGAVSFALDQLFTLIQNRVLWWKSTAHV
jgi:NitT/TauT family transport system permease protein